jgi:hypothetical protein
VVDWSVVKELTASLSQAGTGKEDDEVKKEVGMMVMRYP